MYAAVGINTGKVYVEGESKAECFRKLQSSNPTRIKSIDRPNRGAENPQIYPEPLRIIKGVDKT